MAILLAFPTSDIFKFLTEEGAEGSFYMDLAARLVHFVFVQTVAILLALFAKAWCWWPVNLLGFWVMIYAFLTGIAVALSLMGVAAIYNRSQRPPNGGGPT